MQSPKNFISTILNISAVVIVGVDKGINEAHDHDSILEAS